MARKRNEARPYLPAEGAAASPASSNRERHPRAKSAPAPEPAPAESPVVSAVAEPAPAQELTASAPQSPVSEYDAVSRLAYSYWEARGFQGGSAEEDWLRAEQEYRRRAH